MERKLLSRRFAGRKNVTVLCRALQYQRSQLYFSSDSGTQNNRELVPAHARHIPIYFKGATKDHPFCPAEELRRYRRLLLRRCFPAGPAAGPDFVSTSAESEKR